MYDFELNKKILRSVGLWGDSKWFILPKFYFIGSLIGFSISFIITSYFQWPDVDLFILNFALFSDFFEVGVKAFILIYYKKTIEEIIVELSMMTKRYINPKDEISTNIINHTVKNSRLLTLFFWNFCIVSGFNWALYPIFELMIFPLDEEDYYLNITSKRDFLPFRITLPFDPFQNNFVYVLTYFVQILFSLNLVYVFGGVDSLYYTLIMNTTAQFKVLNENIKKLGNTNLPKDNEKYNKELNSCIEHHIRLINLIRKFELFIGKEVFNLCVMTTSVMCFTGFSIMRKFDIKKTNFLIGYLVEIFMYCLFGERLSTQIVNSAYTYLTFLHQMLD